jgi:hypothetical protein
MKTTKIYTAILLTILFTGIYSVNAENPASRTSNKLMVGSIVYNVNVSFDRDITLCNVYLVQVTDEYGNLVAPAQRFDPATARYTFFEREKTNGKMRIASLVKAVYPNHYVCPNELISMPVQKSGPFFNGMVYNFNLYTMKVISQE